MKAAIPIFCAVTCLPMAAFANPVLMDAMVALQVPDTLHVQVTLLGHACDGLSATRDEEPLTQEWTPTSSFGWNMGSGVTGLNGCQLCDCDVATGSHSYRADSLPEVTYLSTAVNVQAGYQGPAAPGTGGEGGVMPWDEPNPTYMQGIDCVSVCEMPDPGAGGVAGGGGTNGGAAGGPATSGASSGGGTISEMGGVSGGANGGASSGGTTSETGGNSAGGTNGGASSGGTTSETGGNGAGGTNGGASSDTGGATSRTGGASSDTGGATSQTGGASSDTGGATSQTGGRTTGGASTSDRRNKDHGGCSFTGHDSSHPSLAWALLGGIALLRRRRR
ncbi:MAG: hypothetical protein JW751_16295 [Polyangiaceae bacterium]|nr:hypothetical protein [Polyangiaceae bacterium]